ncbi:MAG: aldehyde dehydrogenase family protein, partial [Armatimonadaceae bacterium]
MRDVMSPLDGTFLANVPVSTAAMLNEQLECAIVAASELALQPRFQRIAWLRALHSGLLADMDSLTITMAHEIGKPVLLARTELARALTLIDHTIAVLMTESGDAPYVDDQPAHAARTVMTKRFPIGIVAAITPFNFPINL